MRTTRHTHTATIEELGGCWVDVEITIEADPGDPGVMYYPDGSGCPPTPPSAELIEVRVTAAGGETWEKDRAALGDWAATLDKIAFGRVDDEWDQREREALDDLSDHEIGAYEAAMESKADAIREGAY